MAAAGWAARHGRNLRSLTDMMFVELVDLLFPFVALLVVVFILSGGWR